MRFSTFSKALSELEGVASRNKMVELLAQLFTQLDPEQISPAMYLLQGRVAPLYEPIEFGMSGKLLIRAVARAYRVTEKEVETTGKRTGDLGLAAQEIAANALFGAGEGNVTITQAHESLRKAAQTSGGGSVDGKIDMIANLLSKMDPLSARYVVRIVMDTLRLGFSDMTMLEGLSWMIDGTKSNKTQIENIYNIRPDLGYIAQVVKESGLKYLKKITPAVGTPILMARGERLTNGGAIIDKIGRCAVGTKIDGFRLQIHYSRKTGRVDLFTRNLENATNMYPDVVAGVKKQIDADEAIFEGEAIGYNETSGEFLPFQETVQRKRKYGIEEKALEVPLKLMCFDVLYKNGKVLLNEGYEHRREILAKMIKSGKSVDLVEEKIVETADEVEVFFQYAISRGLEGLMAKRLDGIYQAGGRGWNWIKYKRSYAGKLEDTVDAIVMGYDLGQGKRTGFGIGALLLGVYNPKQDMFETISKMGTGLTDEEWKEMRRRLDKLKVKEKPARYTTDRLMVVDVWAKPEVVVQVRADEITRSPIHTAGRDRGGLGYALRFPRLEVKRDKVAEDATSTQEIEKMYKLQESRRV